MTAKTLTDQQRIACALMGMFAAIAFEEARGRDVWWYRWCVEHSQTSHDPLASTVWWALRFEDDKPDPDWIGYVEYVYGYRAKRAPVSPAKPRSTASTLRSWRFDGRGRRVPA